MSCVLILYSSHTFGAEDVSGDLGGQVWLNTPQL